jgi:hypothetical protein
MSQSIEVDRQDGSVKQSKRRFGGKELKWVADFVVAEHDRRKRSEDRTEKERHWKEIDRQIAMTPENKLKLLPNGEVDANKVWMAEMELPLQAQALEVLTADARRMMFPDSGPWFRAHSEVTDKYLEKINFKSIIHGDESQVPSEVNQDNVDKLVEGFVLSNLRQYDHTARFDQINAEAFKYGMGVARGRKEVKSVYTHEAMGTRSEKSYLPIIVPVSIKNILLDDAKPSMHSSTVLAPSHIAHEWVRFENIAIAASKGSNDPDDEDGGWMPKELGKVHPDKKGFIQLLEMEGDVIIPRKTVRSVVLPNVIITVALGAMEKGESVASRAVIRLRFRKASYSSYLLFPYHYEGADQIYPTSPLMKGRPIQMAATDALNKMMDSSALKNQPPCGYDSNNPIFAQEGGPRIHPGAQWETADPVKVYTEIGGDPTGLASIFAQLTGMYAQLTGVLPARLGAQTISHTTAYAKGAELQQGAVRTVDYVNQCGHGPIQRWLHMAYQIGRDSISSTADTTFWIDAYGGYVSIEKGMLPEKVAFEWFGSGGPADMQQKMANKTAAVQQALQIDMLRVKMGKPPRINLEGMIDETLRTGGWHDLATITNPEPTPGPSAPAPGVPGVDPGNPAGTATSIQGFPSPGS